MSRNRCVVTGLGMLCSLGNNVTECWDAAKNGKSGIRAVTSVSTEGCYSNLGAEVSLSSEALSAERGYDRSVLLCIHAADEALKDAGYSSGADPKTGIILGSCVGGADSIDRYFRGEYQTAEQKKQGIRNMPASAIAGNVASHFQTTGITANIVNACAAGTMSIAYACDLIRLGEGEIFLAGGTDSFSSLAFSGFHALHALSETPCSPFNHSNGITLGEGAGVLVVESYEHAVQRGAKIYCEILGSGISSDAYHITAPRPDAKGQMCAIRRAMQSSGITETDLDYINAHGTGTAKNDEAEFLSIRTLFPNNEKLAVSSTKSMTGHCLGAAGALEAILTVKAVCENTAPPTVGYTEEDMPALREKASGVSFIVNQAQRKPIAYAMSNSFAFGGNNASIVFSAEPHDMPSSRSDAPIVITGVSSLFATEELAAGKGLQKKLTAADFAQYGIRASFSRKLDRFSQLQLLGGMAALQDAALHITEENAEQIGIVIGTADGPMSEITGFQKRVVEKGTANGSAFAFPNTVYNAAGGYFSIASGIRGYSMTLADSAQAGLQSLCCAADAIRGGKAEIMVASGTDENGDIFETFSEELRCGEDGIPYGEGTATLVLESADSAQKRGAKVYATLAGYAVSHFPVPYGAAIQEKWAETIRGTILSALAKAEIKPNDIDVISTFTDGSESVTALEHAVYRSIFSKPVVLLCARKQTGEARAASSMQQAVLGVQLLCAEQPVTDAAILSADDVTQGTAEPKDISYVLAVSCGADGACTAIVLKKAR